MTCSTCKQARPVMLTIWIVVLGKQQTYVLCGPCWRIEERAG